MGKEVEYKNDLNMAKKYGNKHNFKFPDGTLPQKGYWEGSAYDYYYQRVQDQYLDDPDKARWQNDWMQIMIRTQKNKSGSK